MWAIPTEMCLWAYADSEDPDQPAHSCVLTEFLDTTEYLNGEQRPGPGCSKRR